MNEGITRGVTLSLQHHNQPSRPEMLRINQTA